MRAQPDPSRAAYFFDAPSGVAAALRDGDGDRVGPALVGVLALGPVPAELGGLGDGYVDARHAGRVAQDRAAGRGPLAARGAGLEDERVAGDPAARVGHPAGDGDLLAGVDGLPVDRRRRW